MCPYSLLRDFSGHVYHDEHTMIIMVENPTQRRSLANINHHGPTKEYAPYTIGSAYVGPSWATVKRQYHAFFPISARCSFLEYSGVSFVCSQNLWLASCIPRPNLIRCSLSLHFLMLNSVIGSKNRFDLKATIDLKRRNFCCYFWDYKVWCCEVNKYCVSVPLYYLR